jgi:predicted nuclease of predicted toxin-antitoxin system
VANIKMSASTDEEIFHYAANGKFVIISADTDFGFILSTWKINLPSVILLRFLSPSSEIQIKYILDVIKNYSAEINEGSLIVIEPNRVRIRKPPFSV